MVDFVDMLPSMQFCSSFSVINGFYLYSGTDNFIVRSEYIWAHYVVTL